MPGHARELSVRGREQSTLNLHDAEALGCCSERRATSPRVTAAGGNGGMIDDDKRP
jgi:hypothetical protein